MKTAAILAAALVVTACAPMRQLGPSAMDDPTLACLGRLFASDRLHILNSHVGDVARVNSASIEQLASNSTPTAAEKEAISFWGSERMKCLDEGRSFRAQYAPPGYTVVVEGVQMELAYLAAKLYAGNITYGQFNIERNRLAANAEAQIDQVQANSTAPQHDATGDMLRNIGEALRPKTTTTTCNSVFGTVTCRSAR